jgi:HK97 family phage prohead protease
MLEQRFSKASLRASQGDEGSLILSGRAASFGTLSEDLGGFKETIQRGCFTRSIQSDRDVKATFNHTDPILGRKKNGTLRVTEDDKGLNFRAILPDTQAARDVYNLVNARYADSCSFAFSVDGSDGEDWDQCDDPETGERIRRRTLKRVHLHDVSVLAASAPAYPVGTAVTVEANKLPQLNSLSRNMTDYFPDGVPVSFPTEVRAFLLRSQNQSSDLRVARQKLFSLCMN